MCGFAAGGAGWGVLRTERGGEADAIQGVGQGLVVEFLLPQGRVRMLQGKLGLKEVVLSIYIYTYIISYLSHFLLSI